MKTILCCCFLLFLFLVSKAQSLTHFVLSIGRNKFKNICTNLSITVGEMAMVENYSNSDNILTQKFQTPLINMAIALTNVGIGKT